MSAGTVQPDPQEVACPVCEVRPGVACQSLILGSARRRPHEQRLVEARRAVEPPQDPRRDALRCLECEFRADDSPGGWFDLTEHRDATGHRYYEHVRPARRPQTVADIPAGQGHASLYLATDQHGEPALKFKTADGTIEVVEYLPDDAGPEMLALRDLLAASVPTIEETT